MIPDKDITQKSNRCQCLHSQPCWPALHPGGLGARPALLVSEYAATALFLEGVFARFGEATDEVVVLDVGLAVLDQVVDALGNTEACDLRFASQLFDQPPLLLQAFLKLVHGVPVTDRSPPIVFVWRG